MPEKSLIFAFLFSLVALSGPADAELAKKIQTELKGDIVVTLDPLPESLGNPDATLAVYKKRRADKVPAVDKDGVPTWAFYYLAVFKTPAPSSTLGFDFYKDGKLVARKVVVGADKRLTVLRGQLMVSEDDGLLPGAYQVRLHSLGKGGKDVVLAKTSLTTEALPAPKKTSQR